MKRRLLCVLLALCLLAGIMTTAALADGSQTGTVVWFDTATDSGYVYVDAQFVPFSAEAAAAPEYSTPMVGQSVSFTMTEGIITAGSLSVTNSAAMTLSLSGGACVGESLAINAGSIPQAGTVGIRMFHAELQDEIFNNPYGEAESSAATDIGTLTHTVTEESIGKYIGVQLSYCVNIGGTDYLTTFKATTPQAVVAAVVTEDGGYVDTSDTTEDGDDEESDDDIIEDTGDEDSSDTDITTDADEGHSVYEALPTATVQLGSGAATTYASMAEALGFANACEGSEIVTVTALRSSTLTESIILNRTSPIVLDLNGYTLNFESKDILMDNAALTVRDSSEAKTGKLSSAAGEFIKASGTFVLESGSIECTGGVALCSAPEAELCISVKGGSITGSEAAVRLEPYPGVSLTATGGTFTATSAAGTALLTGVNTILSGGTFINAGGGQTIADYSDDGRAVSGFLKPGYSYYPGDGTGTALDTGINSAIAETVTIAKTRVTALNLTALIIAPANGATPQSTFEDQTQFTGELCWSNDTDSIDNPEVFEVGKVYTAILYIEPAENYSLEGISQTAGFSHSGASSVTLGNTDGQYTIAIVFPVIPAPTFLFANALPVTVKAAGAFQINGVPHTAAALDSEPLDLGNTKGKILTAYSYSGGANPYPTGMQVCTMKSTDAGFKVEPVSELDNALQYVGCSIRTTGVRGVRMITGVPEELRKTLLQAEMDGYTLMEYGTVVALQSKMVDGRLTLEDSYAKHNYAYKRGVSDAVFGAAEGLTQFTNVLTNFTLEQCKQVLGMRPYMILEDAKGNTQTIYGGIVYRSIGYIAWQNRDAYEPGTAEYRYIHEIIDYVYGANTPSE